MMYTKFVISVFSAVLLSIGVLHPQSTFAASDTGKAGQKDELLLKIRAPHGDMSLDITKFYKYQLLDLILSKTEATDGPFRIEGAPNPHDTQKRMRDLLDADVYTVFISMTSQEREKEAIPIRIPVFKGLYGHRLLMIRKGEQNRFDAIKTPEDLKQLWAGQGQSWPDTRILEANGYQVTTSGSTPALMKMLKKKRFDFFPRGIHEPWNDLGQHDKAGDLEVEKSLMLYYPAPGYIFVSKKRPELAERLERGFRMALEDGSFDEFFNSQPSVSSAINRARKTKRRVFKLENPLLSPETPLKDERLWFKYADDRAD